MADDQFKHHKFLSSVAQEDVRFVQEKDISYGASWKKRGGVGVFMMLARKWDRLETMLSTLSQRYADRGYASDYDVFRAIREESSGNDGTVLAEVRDLRRYLLLVEAEMMAQGVVDRPRIDMKKAFEAAIREAPGSVFVNTQISAEDIASSASWIEKSLPGTPEDGGHHIRMIEDDPSDLAGDQEKFPELRWLQARDPMTGNVHILVDRGKTPPHLWEHLPRVQSELNQKEFDESPAWYRGLYEHRDLKWRMYVPYLEHWGLLP